MTAADHATSAAPRISEASFRLAVAAGMIAAYFGSVFRFNILDLDVFHELALIREIVATRTFPYRDSFAYTPTLVPAVHHEWGTGVVLYLATVASGWGASGLMSVKFALAAILGLFVTWVARLRGATFCAFALLAPFAFLVMTYSFHTVRAGAFSLVFLSLMLLVWEAEGLGRRYWLVAWPVLFLAWVNMHAGCLVGLGLFGIHVAERFVREAVACRSARIAFVKVRALSVCLAIMALSLLATPYVRDYPAYLWRAVRMPRPLIAEWAPLWRSTNSGLIEAFFLSLAVVGYLVFARGIRHLPGIGVLAVTAWFAMKHQRHVAIYAVVWLCFVPGWFAPTFLGRSFEALCRKRRSIVLAYWSILGLGLLGISLKDGPWKLIVPTKASESFGSQAIYPAGAADYLSRIRFRGNLMTTFGSGGYVSWRLYPDVKVSIDSRYEVAYPPEAAQEAFDFFAARPGWERTLVKYPTDAVLIPRRSRLKPEMTAALPSYDGEKGWRLVYRDDAYCVIVRQRLARSLPIVDRTGQPIIATFP
jgi:hypothetical protein